MELIGLLFICIVLIGMALFMRSRINSCSDIQPTSEVALENYSQEIEYADPMEYAEEMANIKRRELS